MKEKKLTKEQVQKWLKENKTEIAKAIVELAAYGVVFTVGYKVAEDRVGLGIGTAITLMERDGFAKFFNPDTGENISFYESAEMFVNDFISNK